MNALKVWLEQCGAHDVRPCTVTIGKATYHGAHYRETLDIPRNTPAHARGERKYTTEKLYLLGDLPAAYKRSSKTCFRFIGDSRDWYVACHSTPEVVNDDRFKPYHPLGVSVMLCPWAVPDGLAIDHYEPKPYARVGATIDYREG